MKKLIAIAALALAGVAHAGDDWDQTEKIMGSTLLAVTAVDMMQTITIAGHPDIWHEYNPILGRHPSKAKVYGYFLMGGIIKYNIIDALPHSWRKGVMGTLIAVEVGMVAHNYTVGIQMGF